MAQGKVKGGKSHNPAHQTRKQKPKMANKITFSQIKNAKITKDINRNIEDQMRERATQFTFKHSRGVQGKTKAIKK
ncbi:hypothetical protein FGO68_gene13295 [Halteria grandinella]|uniref:Uncharacterized protein n=1 Tax=Halteria grandinella TaxID=5974 RepID=A0A8J8NKZ6_HALGN|nr:hypothetical protein FGO68_gene13295 [Halteria grandinella]